MTDPAVGEPDSLLRGLQVCHLAALCGSWYTKYMMNHAKCDHESTRAARAACRKEKNFELADRVALRTYYWVKKARDEGYTNRIHQITVFEMAREMGIKDFDYKLAQRLVVSKVKSLRQLDMLGDDLIDL